MRITSIRPGSITSVDLGGGSWRLLLTAGSVTQSPQHTVPAVQLTYRCMAAMPHMVLRGRATAEWPLGYEAPVPTFDSNQLVLASAVSTVARQATELAPVAEVSLMGDTEEKCILRATEAMSLFKNQGRVKDEVLQSDIAELTGLIQGYFRLRDWLRGDRARTTITVCDATLELDP